MSAEIVDVGIDPGTDGAVAALDAAGEAIALIETPTAELGSRGASGRKRIVDAGALAFFLLRLAGAIELEEIPSPGWQGDPRWPPGKLRPPTRRLRVWVEQVGPGRGKGEGEAGGGVRISGVSSAFTFGGAYHGARAAVEAVAAAVPDAFVLWESPEVALRRHAVAIVTSPAWARSAGLTPNPDREARLLAYHDAARRRWPVLDRRASTSKGGGLFGGLALLGPRGGANYNKAAALWIADHGRKLCSGLPLAAARTHEVSSP